jgi:dolichyl-phosphate-mannose--protein O-mannosyl transferase
LLDGTLTFLVLAGFGCLLLARDSARHRIVTWAEAREDPLAAPGDHGPRLGVRGWLIAAGVLLGLASGVKWSGAVFLAVFGVMTVLWDLGARRAAGVRQPLRATLRRDLLPDFVTLVGAGLLAYLVTWTGWLATDGGWSRQWAAERDSTFSWIPDSLRSLWHYHGEMLASGRNITSDHAYDSPPIGWLFLSRPVSFFYDGDVTGCGADKCSSAVTALGNPAFWWAGAAAIVVGLGLWLGARDWRAGALLAAVVAGWLPWFLIGDRTVFSWYIVVIAPYLAGLIAMSLGLVLGPADAKGNRRVFGAAAVGAYLMLVLACFAWFWPVWTAEVIPYSEWYRRMWFPSWI